MLGTYFFYKDGGAGQRQSHGVYFVKDEKTHMILLFCSEQSTFWREISEGGDLVGIVQIKKPELVPLDLLEIQELGYLGYVSGVTKITVNERQSLAFDS